MIALVLSALAAPPLVVDPPLGEGWAPPELAAQTFAVADAQLRQAVARCAAPQGEPVGACVGRAAERVFAGQARAREAADGVHVGLTFGAPADELARVWATCAPLARPLRDLALGVDASFEAAFEGVDGVGPGRLVDCAGALDLLLPWVPGAPDAADAAAMVAEVEVLRPGRLLVASQRLTDLTVRFPASAAAADAHAILARYYRREGWGELADHHAARAGEGGSAWLRSLAFEDEGLGALRAERFVEAAAWLRRAADEARDADRRDALAAFADVVASEEGAATLRWVRHVLTPEVALLGDGPRQLAVRASGPLLDDDEQEIGALEAALDLGVAPSLLDVRLDLDLTLRGRTFALPLDVAVRRDRVLLVNPAAGVGASLEGRDISAAVQLNLGVSGGEVASDGEVLLGVPLYTNHTFSFGLSANGSRMLPTALEPRSTTWERYFALLRRRDDDMAVLLPQRQVVSVNLSGDVAKVLTEAWLGYLPAVAPAPPGCRAMTVGGATVTGPIDAARPACPFGVEVQDGRTRVSLSLARVAEGALTPLAAPAELRRSTADAPLRDAVRAWLGEALTDEATGDLPALLASVRATFAWRLMHGPALEGIVDALSDGALDRALAAADSAWRDPHVARGEDVVRDGVALARAGLRALGRWARREPVELAPLGEAGHAWLPRAHAWLAGEVDHLPGLVRTLLGMTGDAAFIAADAASLHLADRRAEAGQAGVALIELAQRSPLGHPMILQWLAKLVAGELIAGGAPAEALALMDAHRDIGSWGCDAVCARAAVAAGRVAEVGAELDALRAVSPELVASSLEAIGGALLDAGRPAEAQVHLLRSLTLRSSELRWRLLIEALAAVDVDPRRAFDLAPEGAAPDGLRALVWYGLETDAPGLISAAAARAPDALGVFALGRAAWLRRDPVLAIGVLDRAWSAKDPPSALIGRALAHATLGETREADRMVALAARAERDPRWRELFAALDVTP